MAVHYLALACDYDGTLAEEGVVRAPVLSALSRLRDSGRRLCMVTGRRLDDLQRVFPRIELFHRIVAENGALVFAPDTGSERILCEPPPEAFVRALAAAGVAPLAVGRVIVATHAPHHRTVQEAIDALGLSLQVILNKGALMVLPHGVDKATGLRAALDELGISPRHAVAVGDAENDDVLLDACRLGVAVSNALPSLKQRADWVTDGARGDGVLELVERMLRSDLCELAPRRALP